MFEQREFTDRQTGIKTVYDYIAIAGTGEKSHKYEVQLKNLVQSEKMALKMISDSENAGEVTLAKGGSVFVQKNEKASDFWEDAGV